MIGQVAGQDGHQNGDQYPKRPVFAHKTAFAPAQGQPDGAHDGSHIDDDVQGHEFVMHEDPVGEEHRHDQGHYREPRQDGGAKFMDVPPADDQVEAQELCSSLLSQHLKVKLATT